MVWGGVVLNCRVKCGHKIERVQHYYNRFIKALEQTGYPGTRVGENIASCQPSD